MTKTIYALGFFDGVHLGHQALLRQCRRLASEYGFSAGAVTFQTHPDNLVLGSAQKLINTVSDRCRLLTAMGAESIITLPFDEALRAMPWDAFLEQLLSRGAAGFVCGDDFRFGFRGEGTAEKLAAFCRRRGMPCAVVPEQRLGDVRISSTHIRGLLEAGDVESACKFMGHPHILSGEVISGRQLGRTIGVPTANLSVPDGVVVPASGVYACRVLFDGKSYCAVTNVGSRPTVGGHHITVEPWILDFAGDLYGKEITLEFHAFLRPEKKFDSLEALKAEIEKNALQTRNFFEKK
jgi:riboflavin kinase/FMN adenylyltransferase